MTLYLLYLVGLFFALTPGVLFTITVKGTYKIALAHAFLFGLLYYLIDEVSSMTEGFAINLRKCKNGGFCESGFKCFNGTCVRPKATKGGPKMQKCSDGGFCSNRASCSKKFCVIPQISRPGNM